VFDLAISMKRKVNKTSFGSCVHSSHAR